MPTTFTDQFFLLDPFSPPPVGTTLNFANYDLIDQNDDDDIDAFDGDSVNGQDVTSSYPGDTVTVNVAGVGNVTYTGTTFYLADGSRVFTPTDGQVLQNGTLVSTTFVNTQGPLDTTTDLGPPCFLPGTLIRTPSGPMAIETLQAGDCIETKDAGTQPIIWVSSRTICGRGDAAPVRILAGTLGNDRDLFVSPQHKLLLSGWQAELYFGEAAILIAAKHLINDRTILRAPCDEVTYIHLLLENHEIIFAENAPTESLDPYSELIAEDRQSQAEFGEVLSGLRSEESSAKRGTYLMGKAHEGILLGRSV